MKGQKQKTLLVILAHPDDESFGIGGTLARYAQEGVAVHLICATGGESGTVEPDFLVGFESIADLREHELRCAAKKLGLASVIMAGYRDSGMPGSADNEHPESLVSQPVEEVASKFASFIRKLRPQVVITHDPIGGYKHPDHIAVHDATVKAFAMASDPAFDPDDKLQAYHPQKLYYSTIPKAWMKFFVRVLPLIGQDPRKFGRNKDIDVLDLVESGDFPIHAQIEYKDYARFREEASACHASQLPSGPPNQGVLSWIMRLIGRKDLFSRAYPEAGSNLHERDLFEGIF